MTILPGRVTTPSAGSAGIYPGEGAAEASLNAPTTTAANPTYKYTSLTTSICTVNDANGELTAVAAGTCNIQIDASGDGVLDFREDVEVTVTALQNFAENDITWSDWPGTATVGVNTSALGAPASAGSGTIGEIQTTSGDCYYNSNTRVLSFAGTTPCVVSVSVSLRGYSDHSQTFTVTPRRRGANRGAGFALRRRPARGR